MIRKTVRNDPTLTVSDTGRTHGPRYADIGTTILNCIERNSATVSLGYKSQLHACYGQHNLSRMGRRSQSANGVTRNIYRHRNNLYQLARDMFYRHVSS